MNKRKLILFTSTFPFGKHENNFIKYEIEELNKLFKEIEIINHKSTSKNSILGKKLNKIRTNQNFSEQINIFNITRTFFFKTIFQKIFWEEINSIMFQGSFITKLKMCVLEITYALILFDFLKKSKINYKDTILYSFWSNFTLITFSMIKEIHPDAKVVARSLGSDLNGFIYNKNDDYVPYKKIKFSSLNKLVLLGKYQKKFLKNSIIKSKNILISPLGVYKQKFVKRKVEKNVIIFLSCGNFIEAKNNILMIDFLRRFSKKTRRKVHFIIIGEGKLKNKIFKQLNNNKKNFIYSYHKHVNNFVEFVKLKKVNFFLNFSSQEGMPFTVMETMSIGIPTISSDIKPNKYLVKNNGYLFNLFNYENSIEQVIKKINFDLNNKKLYYNKCLRSYFFIKKFLINKYCHKKFQNFLKKI